MTPAVPRVAVLMKSLREFLLSMMFLPIVRQTSVCRWFPLKVLQTPDSRLQTFVSDFHPQLFFEIFLVYKC